jgi:hypothetical protein
MSSVSTTALLGSAVVMGSILIGALAQDTTPTVKSCVGEFCDSSASMKHVPERDAVQKKMKRAKQDEKMQDQDQPSTQAKPRKRQDSKTTKKVENATKKTAVVRRKRADQRTNATALVTATADQRTNAITVLDEGTRNRTNKRQTVWPYERRN